MSQTVDVDGMTLTMPTGWQVWKYDDSAFHRNQFQSFAGGSKAVDAVALGSDGVLWLIELKDYRQHRRTKPSSVFAEVALKVRATLAGLAVARLRANDPSEKSLARQDMACTQIRVALQLAQSAKPSRLFPQVLDPMDVQMQLKRAVGAVDSHPVSAVGTMNHRRCPWTTAPTQKAATA
jgi:hypothetical protein